jgi:hypothetical protein
LYRLSFPFFRDTASFLSLYFIFISMSFLYPCPNFSPPYSLTDLQGYIRPKTLNSRTYKYLTYWPDIPLIYLRPTGVIYSKLHKFVPRVLKQISASRFGDILCELGVFCLSWGYFVWVWGYQRVVCLFSLQSPWMWYRDVWYRFADD